MTTRRPPLTQRPRPSSQVYIGPDSTYSSYLSSPPDLPDLPEPPSPGSSSSTSTSGLPSPPATNSTGSGSTGDPGSIAVRGRLNMLNGSNIKTFHAAFQSTVADHHDEDDYDNDNDDDGEDNTARLNQRRHSTSENVLALQRVKSLTERNKMVRIVVSCSLVSPLTVFGSFFLSSIYRCRPVAHYVRLDLRQTSALGFTVVFRRIYHSFAHTSTPYSPLSDSGTPAAFFD